MDIDFSLNFDEQEIKIVVDSSVSLSAIKLGDDPEDIVYRRFDKLDTEEQQEILKKVVQLLFKLEEE